MNEPLGIIEEIEATRLRFPNHVAAHDRKRTEPLFAPRRPSLPRVALTDTVRARSKAVMSAFCEVYGHSLSVDDLKMPSRKRSVAWARHVCIKLVRDICGLSTPQIGKMFCRDHTTVIYALLHADEIMQEDPALLAAHRDVSSLFAQVDK